ncbi:unnamed protein product, partial [Didymodactylos carnosus]
QLLPEICCLLAPVLIAVVVQGVFIRDVPSEVQVCGYLVIQNGSVQSLSQELTVNPGCLIGSHSLPVQQLQ